MTVAAVLLDIDDTLVDTRGAFRAALAHVLERWLPHVVADHADAALRHWTQDQDGHFRAYTRGECTFAEQRRRRAVALHRCFGGPDLDDTAYQAWNHGYEEAFRAAWRRDPLADHLLDALGAAGVAVGAVTNMERAYQQHKLAVVGLAARVPVLAAVDDLGVGKPDARVFALACASLALPPGQVAYVGDELDVDARGAGAAGLIGVWLDTHGTGATPVDVLVARSLADVPRLLGFGDGDAPR